VHPLVDAAGERVGAGLAQALLEPRGDVVGVVEALDLDAGIGEHAFVVGAYDGRDVAMRAGVDRDGLIVAHAWRIWARLRRRRRLARLPSVACALRSPASADCPRRFRTTSAWPRSCAGAGSTCTASRGTTPRRAGRTSTPS